MLNQLAIPICYLSKVSYPCPCSSWGFLDFRLSSTRLLIKWFLIKKSVFLQEFSRPHDIAVSKDGEEIFVGEIGPNKLWKFKKNTA